jgi:Domain of unknown function (DUF5668)
MLTMTPPRPVEITPHMAIGVSLALLGVVLTLDNLGFVEFGEVIRFWPLIPMLVGTAYVVQGREIREWGIGLAWLLVGTAFLLKNLDIFRFELTDFLPLILVAIGLKVIFARRRHHQAKGWPGMPDPVEPPPPGVPPAFAPVGEDTFAPRFPWPPGPAPAQGPEPGPTAGGTTTAGVRGQIIRVFAILWGADRRARGPVAHVEVSAIMGGCDVDLRDAVPTTEPMAIQVFAMWGGIDIRIPPGWIVEIEAWPILGGVVDNTQVPALPSHRVILRGMAFMGGVEIKN